MLPRDQRRGRQFTSWNFESFEDPTWYNVYSDLSSLPERTRYEKEIQIMDKL